MEQEQASEPKEIAAQTPPVEPNGAVKAADVRQAKIDVSSAHPGADILWMTDILERPWRIFYLNMLAGIGRGLGFALGFTILAGGVLTLGYRIVKSAVSMPVVGEYIGTFMAEVQQHASEVRKAQQ